MSNLPPSKLVAIGILAIVVCAPSTANSACQWDNRFKPPAWVCDDPKPPKKPVAQEPWVAVAIDGKGRWGASIQSAGSTVAVPDAMRRCGSDCKVAMQGPGRCVAVAQSKSGGYWVGYAHGNSRETVRRIAFKGCTDRAPQGSCRLEHVNCL